MSNIAVGAQITATVYCLTCFFVLTLDRTGPGPYLLVSNACLEGCLMELILVLIVTKLPCAGPFSGPPPLDCRHIIDFCHKRVWLCWNILQECVCKVSDLHHFVGLQKWLDMYWWRHQSSSKNRGEMALFNGPPSRAWNWNFKILYLGGSEISLVNHGQPHQPKFSC